MFQCHDEKLLHFLPLKEDCLSKNFHLLNLSLGLLLLFFKVDQLGLESFALLSLLLSDFVDFVLSFGDLLTDQKFYLVNFVFVCFNFGFLQGADCSVLFQFFLIDADVDLELFSLIKNFISAFPEGL